MIDFIGLPADMAFYFDDGILFLKKEETKRLIIDYDCEYYFWNNYRIDSRLEKEISAKGVIVYER